MMPDLPAVNASLNALSGLCLLGGYWCAREKRFHAHRLFMTLALSFSTLFLISYLYYHYNVGSTRYQGQGWMRTLYFSILLSHTVLAALIAVLVPVTLVQVWRKRFRKHRAWARWTWPIWLYVSVTGVLVYFFLYQWS